MTAMPPPGRCQLGLVIDLDLCVGCHACAVACKSWNSRHDRTAPLAPVAEPRRDDGVWFNRVHSFEVGSGDAARTAYFPRSCLHCRQAPCVTVCPTGASHKRAEDGIVLIEVERCIGCHLCAWSCPYGAREFDRVAGVMRKCTLCVDRIDDGTAAPLDRLPACVRACPTGARHLSDLGDPDSTASCLVAARNGYDLMPELGTQPTNKYLPPRTTPPSTTATAQLEPRDDPLAQWATVLHAR